MKLLAMVLVLLFSLFTVLSARHLSNNDEVNEMFSSWLVKHSKIYHSFVEKTKRFQIFKDNVNYIQQHNFGNNSYKLGLNKFADLSLDEYHLLYTGAKKIDSKHKFNNVRSDRYSIHSSDVLPDSIDWRTKGAIAAVKDQGSCGSCWAFSTIGSVEAINQIMTGDLVTLSEQELIDCDTRFSQGCNGGYMDHAFEFIINNGGIDLDKDYPYTGTDGRCNITKKKIKVVSIDNYEDVPVNNELALQKAAANQPITVTIEASGQDFQFYTSGIFDGSCGTNLDHGVVVVGYGTEEGKDYWIVRNSWGAEWGEEGYIRMERNIEDKEGKCGIAMAAFYPVKYDPNPPTPSPSPSEPTHP
ncbi:hypothetical protein SSX86_007715 [Deinandra increscens subsp. villosa]|uniref:Actinidain n=1 Tax=Deinandra increscens subsp. villosa TaxID=3103831 RepID=A0AAP0DDZ5_9ASTR